MAIDTYDKLVDAMTLLKGNISTYMTELGATAADVTWVTNTLNNLTWMRDRAELGDANKKSVTEIRSRVYRGPAGEAIPALPANPSNTPPNPLEPDALGEFNKLKSRFKAGPGYTHEIGIACGLASESPDPPDPSSLTPIIEEISAAQANYLFSLIAANRGESDQYQVFTQPVEGDHPWVLTDTVTTRAADITWTPVGGLDGPQQVRVKIQLRRKGQNYGLESAIVIVTLNP